VNRCKIYKQEELQFEEPYFERLIKKHKPMKKIIFFACMLFSSLQLMAQKTQEDLLIEAILELNSLENSEDKIALNLAVQKFDTQLIYILENENINSFKKFENGLDSLYTDFSFKQSGDYELFSLRKGLDRWNYILKNKKVILKDFKTFDYFYDIHSLNNKEFLLIKRMDEMSFTCYNAFVMKVENNSIIRQDAFKDKMDFLEVCSWTSLDSTYYEKDPITGTKALKGGLTNYKPLEIQFDEKRKIISYRFLSQINGKTITRKAKYRNGTFKIKCYNARTFEE